MRGLRGNPALARLNHGIERESLRITPSGALSVEPHPNAFGSPLSHPAITTDFSEAQLELITGVHPSVEACIQELSEIHAFVHQCLDDELLWPASMPCGVSGDEGIPIARYGRSNAARFKEIYREGLGHRYGRVMQTISGIHYNFSVPDALWDVLGKIDGVSSDQHARDDGYFRLVRNFRLHGWLLIYLFGASPAVCSSFLRHKEHNLQPLDASSSYLPFATSLRMGPLGYQSEAQSRHRIVYDSLPEYVESMLPALLESHPQYARIGIREGASYNQLTDALLQVEAEFYGSIRVKRKTQPRERAIVALRRRGVEYVEVRSLDANPFDPVGINVETGKFLDIFLLHSLLTPNAGETSVQARKNLNNQLKTVHRGLDPKLGLEAPQGSRRLVDWAHELLNGCRAVANALDEVHETNDMEACVDAQFAKLADASRTPAAKMLGLMTERQQPFASLGLELAFEHHESLMKHALPPIRLAEFRALARQSDVDREELEANETEAFEDYLRDYLSMRLDS